MKINVRPAATVEHLLQACELVEQAGDGEIRIPGMEHGLWHYMRGPIMTHPTRFPVFATIRTLSLHAIACLLTVPEDAREHVSLVAHAEGRDYDSLDADVRTGLMQVLGSASESPQLVRQVLSGDVLIGTNVLLRSNVTLGSGSVIGDFVQLWRNVRVGAGVRIDQRTFVADDVVIDDGAWLQQHVSIYGAASIGKYAVVGAHSVFKGPTVVEDNVIVPAGVSVERSRNSPTEDPRVTITSKTSWNPDGTICE